MHTPNRSSTFCSLLVFGVRLGFGLAFLLFLPLLDGAAPAADRGGRARVREAKRVDHPVDQPVIQSVDSSIASGSRFVERGGKEAQIPPAAMSVVPSMPASDTLPSWYGRSLRVRVQGPEGILVVYDTPEYLAGLGSEILESPSGLLDSDVPTAGLTYSVYWRQLPSGDLYVYQSPVRDLAGLGEALRRLEDELDVSLADIANTIPSLWRAYVEAKGGSGEDPGGEVIGQSSGASWRLVEESGRLIESGEVGGPESVESTGGDPRWRFLGGDCDVLAARAEALPPPEKFGWAGVRLRSSVNASDSRVPLLAEMGDCDPTLCILICRRPPCTGPDCVPIRCATDPSVEAGCGACVGEDCPDRDGDGVPNEFDPFPDDSCNGGPCCGGSCCGGGNCCNSNCCDSPGPCCSSTDPCCGSEDPCCGNDDPCDPDCGDPCACLDCDDGNSCTCDFCDPPNGCMHLASASPCSIQELYGGIESLGEYFDAFPTICNYGDCQGDYSWRFYQSGGSPLIGDTSGIITNLSPGECRPLPLAALIDSDSPCGTATMTLLVSGCSTPGLRSVSTTLCSKTISVTVGLRVSTVRTGEIGPIAYILPNDVEDFRIEAPSVDYTDLHYVISDSQIAQFRVNEQLVSSWAQTGVWTTMSIHGLEQGETLILARDGSPTGPIVCTATIKVGGSITFQFDQLPTYVPYPVPYQQTCMTTLRGQAFVCEDYQLDHLDDAILGPLSVPQSTMQALEAVPNAGMAFRIVVKNAIGQPMKNVLVIGVPVQENADPTINRMNVTPLNPQATDTVGRITGTIRVANPNGYLEANIPYWRLVILVGETAERFAANPNFLNPDVIFPDHEVPLAQRMTNGHLIHNVRDNIDGLGGRIETAMAMKFPHVSARAQALLEDMFNNRLERVSFSVDSSGMFPLQPWRLWDLHTNTPLEIESPLWSPPGIRQFSLDLYPKPIDISQPFYPNDEVSLLMRALSDAYRTELLPNSTPIVPGDPTLRVGTVAAEIILALTIPGWDLVDITKEAINVINGEEFNSNVFMLACFGASADLGTLVWAPLGAPANAVAAFVKGFFKIVPAGVTKGVFRVLGGGFDAMLRVGRFFKHFLGDFASASDWINPFKYREALENLIRQFFGMVDSPVLRLGGASDDVVGEAVGVAVDIMGTGTRKLSDPAAEGMAAMVRHVDGGETEVRDLMTRIVNDDARESVGEAVSKTYRNEILDSPGTPNHDPFGKKRVDEAVEAARHVLDPHLRSFVTPHIGPNGAFKSMEEFEALRFMRAENLKPEQVSAINAIRSAIPNPVTGTPMQKVIKGADIDSFIDANSNISGFVAKTDDAGTGVFSNSDEMVEGLRLDYEGGFQGQISVGVIEWDFNPAAGGVEVPRTPSFGGNLVDPDPYPFVGNGFTATKSGRLVPEYRVPLGSTITPPEGAKLYELSGNGQKTLRGVFQNGAWLHVGG